MVEFDTSGLGVVICVDLLRFAIEDTKSIDLTLKVGNLSNLKTK